MVHTHQVMEFLPGGDLMSLLLKEDTFPEAKTLQYMAEIIQAVSALASCNACRCMCLNRMF
jgi:serine/threonine protein kinase